MMSIRLAGQYDRAEMQAIYDESSAGLSLHRGFPFGCLLLSVFWLACGEERFGLISVALGCGAWLAIVPGRVAAARRQQIDTAIDSIKDRPFEIVLDDAGISFDIADQRHRYAWTEFDDFGETRLFVELRRRGQSILTIPKRLLKSEDDLTLRDLLIRHFRTAEPPVSRAFSIVIPHE